MTHQSGAASVARCRAPLLVRDSSSTAPTTVTRTPFTGVVAAATNAASGPFASTAPRPTSSSPSILTGISPGTVSMCPSRTTWTGPSPISPTALPASSTFARKPRSAIRATSHSTASPSRRETLGVWTGPGTRSESSSPGHHRAIDEVADRARERDRAHRHPAGDRFGEAQDVRHQSVLLYREERARPAEAGLDLVDDQERTSRRTESRGFLCELAGRRPDASLSL